MSSKRPPTTDIDSSCHHIQALLKGKNAQEILRCCELGFKMALAFNSNASSYHEARSHVKCQNCPSYHSSGSIVCIQCSYVGCIDHGKKVHASSTGHMLGIDVTNGEGALYCYGCGDYIINDTIEEQRKRCLRSVIGVSEKHILSQNKNLNWNSDVMIIPPYQATTGLRGFYNMGSTCFISVILQSLIHNPFVRNFFLAGGHDRNQCRTGSSSACISCFLDEMFCDFYNSTKIEGYGVPNLLILVSRLKKVFTGASQQDAHEFLQFLMDEVHQGHFQSNVFPTESRNTSPVPELIHDSSPSSQSSSSDEGCNCIAHSTFYGQFESRIRCSNCANITKTVDPMMDLSLEINRVNKSVITLEDCLDLFTSPEKLDILYQCENCQQRCPVDKQLSIRRLPSVLSIQLKRFDVTGISNTNKIETPVQFPLYLDMSKYTAGMSNEKKQPLLYQLFGVVCHKGSLNTGHYTCKMKDRYGRWFNFDDSMVSKVTISQVLNSNAYLLFYIINECP